jgi:hypothetical protein
VVRPKSFAFKVPKTGLEPALPLQEPAPEAGLSANQLYCFGVGVMLQVLKDQ